MLGKLTLVALGLATAALAWNDLPSAAQWSEVVADNNGHRITLHRQANYKGRRMDSMDFYAPLLRSSLVAVVLPDGTVTEPWHGTGFTLREYAVLLVGGRPVLVAKTNAPPSPTCSPYIAYSYADRRWSPLPQLPSEAVGPSNLITQKMPPPSPWKAKKSLPANPPLVVMSNVERTRIDAMKNRTSIQAQHLTLPTCK